MKVLSELKPNSLREFVGFLITNGINTDILKVDDIRILLFYILDFLKSKHIFITIVETGYAVTIIEDKRQKIILCEFDLTDLLIQYKVCILSAFDYIEKPF